MEGTVGTEGTEEIEETKLISYFKTKQLIRMIPYINIHTHHLGTETDISIYNNRFLFEDITTDCLFSIGIHPYDCHLLTDHSFKDMEPFLKQDNCFAIGECGLDKLISVDLKQQQFILTEQLNLALIYKKPVIIHCVKAFDELIDVCKPYETKLKLIIHGFNKSEELALQLISRGYYLSLHPSLVKKDNFNFTKLQIEQLFFETDDDSNLSINEAYRNASIKLNLSESMLKEKIYSNFKLLFL
jgi:TatD DNase family protein